MISPLKTFVFATLLACCATSWSAVNFRSAHAIVIDESTGEVLLSKDPSTAAPIASLTKLMTVMVVLDAGQDASEPLLIDELDMDHLKHTRGGVPAGASLPRGTLIELALIASDNHAASALARHFPGGLSAFHAATDAKIAALSLVQTTLVEPTGLSPLNHASASDMAKVLQATTHYPVISNITSQREHSVLVNGLPWAVRNTNGLVGKAGWNILSSKTGFTNEAGRCLTMRLQAAGRTVIVVLMGAVASSSRALDALHVRHWLSGESDVADASPHTLASRSARKKAAAVVSAAVVNPSASLAATVVPNLPSVVSPAVAVDEPVGDQGLASDADQTGK